MAEPMTDAKLAWFVREYGHDTGQTVYRLAAEATRLRAGIRAVRQREDVGIYAAAELDLLLGEGAGIVSDIDDIVRMHVHGTLDPADSMGAFISENAAIVRELAERGPFYTSNGTECATCPLQDAGYDMDFDDPATHEPSCLWKRARELYPKALE